MPKHFNLYSFWKLGISVPFCNAFLAFKTFWLQLIPRDYLNGLTLLHIEIKCFSSLWRRRKRSCWYIWSSWILIRYPLVFSIQEQVNLQVNLFQDTNFFGCYKIVTAFTPMTFRVATSIFLQNISKCIFLTTKSEFFHIYWPIITRFTSLFFLILRKFMIRNFGIGCLIRWARYNREKFRIVSGSCMAFPIQPFFSTKILIYWKRLTATECLLLNCDTKSLHGMVATPTSKQKISV